MEAPEFRRRIRREVEGILSRSRPTAKAKVRDGIDLRARMAAWLCRRKGTGAGPDEVLYDLLEVRITGLEMPAARRMFSSPYMLKLSILER